MREGRHKSHFRIEIVIERRIDKISLIVWQFFELNCSSFAKQHIKNNILLLCKKTYPTSQISLKISRCH